MVGKYGEGVMDLLMELRATTRPWKTHELQELRTWLMIVLDKADRFYVYFRSDLKGSGEFGSGIKVRSLTKKNEEAA